MNFLNNPEYSSIKVFLTLALVVGTGVAVYRFSGNRNLDQSGRALNTRTETEKQSLTENTNDPQFFTAPTILSIIPNVGPTTGMASVTITGTSFSSDITATLDSLLCTNLEYVNDTTIKCKTPPHPIDIVDVTVTQSSGTATLTDGYQYISAPVTASDGILIGNTGTISTTGTGKTPTVSFTTASQSISESQSTTTIIAKLSSTTSQTVTVPLTVTPGFIPLSSSDYNYTVPPPSTSTLLTFLPNQTQITFTVGIINDTLTEQTESALFKLGTPTNAVLGTIPTHTLTVTDNDVPPPCTITLFSATPTSVMSGSSSTLNWKTSNCTTGSINQGIGPIAASALANGSTTTGPLMTTTTYTLTASSSVNTTSAQVTVTVTLPACTSNTWTQKADFGGGLRHMAIGFSIGTKGYLGTGKDSSGIKYKDFWEYNPTTNTWTQKADFPDTVVQAVGFAIGDKGYVGLAIGGMIVNANDFWEYNPATNTWTQKADFSGAHTFGVGFGIGTKGYIGTGNNGMSTFYDFWQYDSITDTWTQKADFGGGPRMEATGLSIGSKGYIGLGTNGSGTDFNDFWEYNPVTDVWTQKANFGGTERTRAVGFSIGSKGYIGTGEGWQVMKKDFWEYNPTTNTWTQKADFGGTSRREAVGFSVGSKGYIGIGHEYLTNTSYKDVWEYCP